MRIIKYIPAGILILTVGGMVSWLSGYSARELRWWGIVLPVMVLAYILRDTELHK